MNDMTHQGDSWASEEVSPLVYEELSKLAQIPTKKHCGTGLPLAISPKFRQFMGGDITVASEAGEGSTFTVTLPRVVEAGKVGEAK